MKEPKLTLKIYLFILLALSSLLINVVYPGETPLPLKAYKDNPLLETYNADLAEQYPSQIDLEEGDVVILDQEKKGFIKKTEKAYDPLLLGVISTAPGIVLGKESPGERVALAGRVPVKVTTMNGEIEVGDYLTSAPKLGYAMKADSYGPIIGKALESFKNKKEEQETLGKIMVFVNLGWMGSSEEKNYGVLDWAVQNFSGSQENIPKKELEDNTALKEVITNSKIKPSPINQNNSPLSPTPYSLFEDKNKTSQPDLNARSLQIAEGELSIDELGNLSLTGAIISTGSITSTGYTTLKELYIIDELTTSLIAAPAYDNLSIRLGDSLGSTSLNIMDKHEGIKASINSEGKISSHSLETEKVNINLKEDAYMNSVGTANLPSRHYSVKIKNKWVEKNSLIFITPLNSTANQVLYIKTQDKNSFEVAIDKPVTKDISFNYWIIN